MTTSAPNSKLTDVRLRALLDRPPSERIELKDGTIDGLTLRVGPRGRPTWTFRFRIRGEGGITERGTKLNGVRYHRVSLGSYPDVTIKEARRKAAAYADDAAAGRNPLTDFQERAIDKRDTVAALVEDYVAHAEQSMRSWRNAKWTLERHIVSAWGERPTGGITDSDAKSLINKVAQGTPDPETGIIVPRPGAANETRKWGSLLFQWAIDERRAKANPFTKVKTPKLGTRQRYLSMEEARAVWAAADAMREPWGPAIQLLMLTGCREMEICAARWSWFDAQNAELIVPPEHYKSGRHFLVGLPFQAMTVIDTLTRWNEGDFMLSTTNGAKPIAGVPRKIIDQLHSSAEKILGSPMPRFALHDFRRSVRTHLSRLEVDAHVAEMVLGHAIKGLRASYDLYGYSKEKRHALALWATDLLVPPEDEGGNGVSVLSTALEALAANEPLSEEQREALLAHVGEPSR
ncbi:Phage integrase [Sphingopyxis sp. LC81]|uniref:tyrosine-type recombinase/integrase n=1 Tax=Sphingopyxis sp. LC81 TaxID=1502850 RepID=UPI00050DD201|nr:integrase family protein [Sphingopyxis sp. LC81]KGB52647.1 Phage integrase [Sphingopyxis sp. LC81]